MTYELTCKMDKRSVINYDNKMLYDIITYTSLILFKKVSITNDKT